MLSTTQATYPDTDRHRHHLAPEHRGPPGWSAYAPGSIAGMVFRKDCQGQVSSRTQPVFWAEYHAVQLPVSR